MSNECPFHPGLTSEDTGYPAHPYINWFWTPAELTNIERRQRKRGHAVDEPILRDAARQIVSGPVNGTALRIRRTCPACGEVFQPRSGNQRFCTDACRKQAAKQDGRRVA